MASNWGTSWGTSWGSSWGAAPIVIIVHPVKAVAMATVRIAHGANVAVRRAKGTTTVRSTRGTIN